MENTQKLFRDESSFQGWTEYHASDVDVYRVDVSDPVKKFYKLENDAFVKIGNVKTSAKTPLALHRAAQKVGIL